MKRIVEIFFDYIIMSLKYSSLVVLMMMIGVTLLTGSPVNAQAQNEKIALDVKNKPLKEVFKEIERQTDYRFVFNQDVFTENPKLNISTQSTLSQILAYLERNTNNKYQVVGKNIAVSYQSAQTLGSITGRVVDQLGNPLVGATIKILATNGSLRTDKEGKFTNAVKAGSYTVEVSYVAYQQQQKVVQVLAGKPTEIKLILLESMDALNEVVVIGYGTIKRSDLTGSVTDISAEKLKDQPVTSIDQQLVGRVAGMQISQGSGAPGAGTTIKIRGNGSLGAGNDPLYVVDGMPYSAESSLDTNPLSFINPADIENISVLKDASSTAIYGSYANVFNAGKKDYHETIFSVQFSESAADLANSFIFFNAPSTSKGEVTGRASVALQVNIAIKPTTDLINAFEENDQRYAVAVGEWRGADDAGQLQDFFYCAKYKGPQTAILGWSGDNFPILRYSDVLLMYAEALNELNRSTEAFTYVKQVRDRAGLLSDNSDLSKTSLAKVIEKERRVEFCFENQRWYDLLRTDRAIQVMQAVGKTISEKDLLAPIPGDQILINQLEQNPGY